MSYSWQPERRDSPQSYSSPSYGPSDRSYGYPGPEYDAPPPPQSQAPRGWGYATGGPWPGAEAPYPGPHPYAQFPETPYADPYGYGGQPPYGAEQMRTVPLAGWWIRFAAYFIDWIIAFVVMCLIGVAAAVIVGAVSHTATTSGDAGSGSSGLAALLLLGVLAGALLADLIFLLWYFPGAWARSGQTLGQRWLGIMVIGSDGQLIGFGRALLRYIIGMTILDFIVFGLPLGLLWAAWDARKQAWHDKIADTIVVRV